MKQKELAVIVGCAILGGLAALVGNGGGQGEGAQRWCAPVLLAGQGLRKLSLSGFWGNVGAWVLVGLVCALPLGALLVWRRRRGSRWVMEDSLAALAAVVLFAMLYYAVNPTWLSSPAGELFPLAAGGSLLSMGVAWLALQVLRGLEDCPQERLSGVLRPLLAGGGGLLAFFAVYSRLAVLLARSQEVIQGNTADPAEARFTCVVLGVLAALEAAPYLMGAIALLWGGELAQALGEGFGEEAVAKSQRTALGCKLVVQASVMLTLLANLTQLALFGQMRSTHFSVYIPLFPLLVSGGLFLLCRLVRRGRELQEDSESII